MTALHLDQMTWAEVQKEIENGRDSVVVPFGSTEQHGRHLPLGTDAIIGDEIGRGLAERLGAFIAPTVRIGCSQHHLVFPGTISLREETLQRIIIDVVASLSGQKFRRIILIPTHGGNFKPLEEAIKLIKPIENIRILAFTDLKGLINRAFESSKAFGVDERSSGAHSGEWETSLMLALRPQQVKMDCAAEGFVGDLSEVMSKVFDGIQNLDKNGVLGDPRPANEKAGKKYLEEIIEFLYTWVSEQDQKER